MFWAICNVVSKIFLIFLSENLDFSDYSYYICFTKLRYTKNHIMETITPKFKKSVKLSPAQVKGLKDTIKKFPTMTEAAIHIGIGRDVLIRVIEVGRCNEITYNKLFNN